MPSREKQKKKSWKEKQRERQTKQQRAQEAYEIQRERDIQIKRTRKYPKGKIILGICLIGALLVAYLAWQASTIGTTNNPFSTNNPTLGKIAPTFSLTDINGSSFSLSQQAGKVIAVHFMAVSCGGGIVQTNENQLRTLKTVCSSYCGENSASIVTVAATTCSVSCLEQIRSDYSVTWTLGNDYDDGTADIVNAYSAYSIADGAIVLIDRNSKVAEVYTKETSFTTLSSRINQLL